MYIQSSDTTQIAGKAGKAGKAGNSSKLSVLKVVNTQRGPVINIRPRIDAANVVRVNEKLNDEIKELCYNPNATRLLSVKNGTDLDTVIDGLKKDIAVTTRTIQEKEKEREVLSEKYSEFNKLQERYNSDQLKGLLEKSAKGKIEILNNGDTVMKPTGLFAYLKKRSVMTFGTKAQRTELLDKKSRTIAKYSTNDLKVIGSVIGELHSENKHLEYNKKQVDNVIRYANDNIETDRKLLNLGKEKASIIDLLEAELNKKAQAQKVNQQNIKAYLHSCVGDFSRTNRNYGLVKSIYTANKGCEIINSALRYRTEPRFTKGKQDIVIMQCESMSGNDRIFSRGGKKEENKLRNCMEKMSLYMLNCTAKQLYYNGLKQCLSNANVNENKSVTNFSYQTVYRGQGITAEGINKLVEFKDNNTLVSPRAFYSTSSDRGVAYDFAKAKSGEYPMIVEIEGLSGESNDSDYSPKSQGECEYIFSPQAKFEIKEIHHRGSTRFLKLKEVLPSDARGLTVGDMPY